MATELDRLVEIRDGLVVFALSIPGKTTRLARKHVFRIQPDRLGVIKNCLIGLPIAITRESTAEVVECISRIQLDRLGIIENCLVVELLVIPN